MTPTAEQTAILDAVRNTPVNLLVNARAGAAKTTILELIAHEQPDKSILAIAFNKKIATALAERLPPNCTAITLNALGFRMWRDFIGKWPKVNARKSYFLWKAEVDGLPPEEREHAYELMSEVLEGLQTAKAYGYLPPKTHGAAKPLISPEDFYSDVLDFSATDEHRYYIDRLLIKSFKKSLEGEVDFDDQVYLPAIMPCSYASADLTLIDEAQDLSAANHVLLQKVVRKKRIIAVGDPCQAIYGFRGASANSMNELRFRFDMQEFFLTVCFRSAESIIRNVHWRAPDMVWRTDAPFGMVEQLPEWGPGLVQDNDAIICRNNAPLFAIALSLLRAGRSPELASGDMLKNLTSVCKKLGPSKTPAAAALEKLEEWRVAEARKRKNTQRVDDTAACIEVFLLESETAGEALRKIEEVCNRPGRIKLMTGHKSKGLEFDRVFFLDQFLCDRKRGQDANVEYVIETRARNELYYVESASWIGGVD